jgi:hypothetical protein
MRSYGGLVADNDPRASYNCAWMNSRASLRPNVAGGKRPAVSVQKRSSNARRRTESISATRRSRGEWDRSYWLTAPPPKAEGSSRRERRVTRDRDGARALDNQLLLHLCKARQDMKEEPANLCLRVDVIGRALKMDMLAFHLISQI